MAGNGTSGFSGDGGPAASAQLHGPYGVAVDAAGNLYVADAGNNRIRKVSPGGVISTVAGNGAAGSSGDGGLAADSELNFPEAVAVDASGSIFIADTNNNRIRRVSPTGIISTVAGNGRQGDSSDGTPATSAQLNLPRSVSVDASGNLYVTDFFDGVAVDPPGQLSITDIPSIHIEHTLKERIRRVLPSGLITTIAGGSVGYSGDGGPAAGAQLRYPQGLALDASGNLYIADTNNNRIRKVSPSGIISTVAGNGTFSYSGDGGSAGSAQLYLPGGVTLDNSGNLYISDQLNNRIRKVSYNGIITTVAGNGTKGYSGDGGLATNAQLYEPVGVAVDASGNLYIADGGNDRVRKVSPSGIITTVVGNGIKGYSGDGGPAINARLHGPGGLAVDASGNLYIADSVNQRVRKVSRTGIITTVAGSGIEGSSGDGGRATNSQLDEPAGLAVDRFGNLIIADARNNRIRKVSPSGIITTVAGNGTNGYSGDGGPAVGAQLNLPQDVAVDASGNLYIADNNNRIRKVSSGGTIITIAGAGPTRGFSGGYTGDGGPATSAELQNPWGVAVDATGNIYVADAHNNVIRLLQQSR